VILLIDENLPKSLVKVLEPHFPGSVHVKQLQLTEKEDTDLWQYAKQHGFSIISKDKDFQQMSVLRGSPPKVIWLRMGNNPASRVIELLNQEMTTIKHFMGHANRSLLILGP
jgi:predicted nuclease of predicted toxin-antitoxin system